MLVRTWGAVGLVSFSILAVEPASGSSSLTETVVPSGQAAETTVGETSTHADSTQEKETFVDESGAVVTLDEMVESCRCQPTDDIACPESICTSIDSAPCPPKPLHGFWSKIRSFFTFPRFSQGLFAKPVLMHHAHRRAETSCEDVCIESGDGDGTLETIDEGEEPVTSSSEPCPACMHVIAPSPATAPPSPSSATSGVQIKPVTEDAPPLPRAEAPSTAPVTEDETSASPRVEKTEDVPLKQIPVESLDPKNSTSDTKEPVGVIPTGFVTNGIHAEDFAWIVGELRFQHTRGGVWTLRYLPLDQTDAFGGQVLLHRDPRLAAFKEGDIVRVEGRVGKSTTTGSTTYRMSAISKVE
jgi:hypothetical protein